MPRVKSRAASFTVRDHGIGIPVADLGQLYQAFHRGSNVGDTPGTGLGMTVVKRCVDLHGGRITVQSQEGSGTTFTVMLPLFGGATSPGDAQTGTPHGVAEVKPQLPA